ncbi:MAG: RNHCP domain-containing protein [Bacilli bacterium]|nr:RNHCP domain-containing protein [Bacilli bacterium]
MKAFHELDEGFICENCGRKVVPLEYSSRDHCPYCLYSKHVDIQPGDRQNSCRGFLKPIDVEKYKDTYKIIYQCEKCGDIHKNIMAKDDDLNEVIRISAHS